MSSAIVIDPTDLAYIAAYERLDGKIALAGGDLWDTPTLSAFSPSAARTSLSLGPIWTVPTGAHLSFYLQQASYSVKSGTLYGKTQSGAGGGLVVVNTPLPGDTIIINSAVFTAVAGAPGPNQFQIGGFNDVTAINLANAVIASTNVNIVNKIQPVRDGTGSGNLLWFEWLVPGAVGNTIPITSSNNSRLTITTFQGGSDAAVDLQTFWSFVYGPQGINLTAGQNVRFKFDIVNFDCKQIGVGTLRMFINFNDGAGAHYVNIPQTAGTFISPAFAPTGNTSNVTVGIDVAEFSGNWSFGSFHLLLDNPTTHATAGLVTAMVDLSSGSSTPLGDPTTGISGNMKRVGYFYGVSFNTQNEATIPGFQSGDIFLIPAVDTLTFLLDAQTHKILTDALAKGIEVYGYLGLGRNADAPVSDIISTTTFTKAFAAMKAYGFTGVFFDIAGQSAAPPNGFGVSRFRQNWVLDACHALGMRVIFNGGSNLLQNNIDPRLADPDDGVQHTVNDGTPLRLHANDGMVLESFGISSIGQWSDWAGMLSEGSITAQAIRDIGVRVFPLFYALPNSNFIQQAQQEAFAFYTSCLFGFSGYAILGPGLNLLGNRPNVGLGNIYIDAVPVSSPGGTKLTRATDSGTIIVSRNPSVADNAYNARSAGAYQRYSAVKVDQITFPQTLNGGTVDYSYATSDDGINYTADIPLTNTAGVITGFPTSQSNFLRLKILIQTPNPAQTPLLTQPLTITVDYIAAGYCKVHGIIFPSVVGETLTTVEVTYTRKGTNPLLIGLNAYAPTSEKLKVPVNPVSGVWQIQLIADLVGTQYDLLIGENGNNYLVENLNLTAGGNVRV